MRPRVSLMGSRPRAEGRTRRRVFAAIATLAVSIAAASCSSAPKPPEAAFEVKNQAAEYAALGDRQMAEGRYAAALGYYEMALEAGSSVDDLAGVSASLASMGRAYAAVGQAEDARREYGAALDYAMMAASPSAQAAAKSGLGELLYGAGDAEGALVLFEEAVVLATKAEGEAGGKARAVALHDRAVAMAALGRAGEAKAGLSLAMELNRKARRWPELGSNNYVLASILAGEGALDEALDAALAALDSDKRGENARSVPLDLSALASLSSRLGRDDEAWGYWRRSFDSSLATGDAVSARRALTALVELAPRLGKAEEGERYGGLLEKLDADDQGANGSG